MNRFAMNTNQMPQGRVTMASNVSNRTIFGRSALRAVLLLTVLTLALSGLSSNLFAQENNQGGPQTLDEVLRAMQQERRAVSQENQEREARFLRRQENQQQELNRVRNQVAAAEEEASRLENLRNELDRELEEMRQQLSERQGEFGELFGVARAAATDLAEQLEDSLISTQFEGRSEDLMEMAQASRLPTVEQLEDLWFTMLQEAGEQGRVVRYDAPVVLEDNRSESRSVVRIGPFSAFTDEGYLVNQGGQLRYLVRQPGGGAVSAAERVYEHSGEGVVRGMIDPSQGSLLGLVKDTPTLGERIDQGGWIGYAIIVVAIFGILVALYRWIMLMITSMQVRSQMNSSTPSKSNPLGRVMLAYEEHKSEDLETLQLHLDDAVLQEIPKLERGLNIVKVLAAVAPLMGLLGTVIGMIVTFQAITLFGTGDPKLMAGGISQALITTVLGLIAAVPLLLLHAFAAGSSRRLSQILEEQSVSFVADAGERK